MMNRKSFLYISGVEIPHEEQGGLYFEAEYNSGKINEIGSMIFKIYNLSQDVSPGTTIDYDFYRGDFGGRFGTYTVKKRNLEKNGGDTVQVLFCSERAIETSNIVSVSLKGQITADKAIKEICKAAGLNPVSIELKINKTFPNSFSCYGKALDELKELATDTSSQIKIENKDVYFYIDTIKQQKGQIIELNFSSGLLKNPRAAEELTTDNATTADMSNPAAKANYLTSGKLKAKTTNQYDFIIECLSIHTLKKGVVLQIGENKVWSGLCKIVEMEMRNNKTWVQKLKVKVI